MMSQRFSIIRTGKPEMLTYNWSFLQLCTLITPLHVAKHTKMGKIEDTSPSTIHMKIKKNVTVDL